ncbi:Transposon Ty3-G Gag-Pol polyprotein [Trichinella nativa]|uniref:Transposon Ty3-G Gag-Pol polyprotein n=1 Tax=Trichinella nativa TaxID=6335 RepID=A0A0V1L9D1_9BILA|nr:Transposon Ty3-G Gag-Pol polyprotein [Trichinella nativa]
MYSVEWLERLQDFLCVSRVPLSHNDVVARENSSEEFKKRLLDAYGPEESAGQLIERFHALHQREGQTIEQYAKEVVEVGRRAGVTERDLMARFAGGITSKEAYLAIRLQEPTTLTEAQRFVTKVMRSEEHFHQRRQTHTGNSKPEKTETTQSIYDFIRETPNQRPPAGTHSGGPGNRRVLSMAGLQAGDTPCITSGGEPLERETGTILLTEGRRMCISGVGVEPLQLGHWRGRVPVMVVRIEHDPVRAEQPGIGCAIVAKPRGVGSDAGIGADGPKDWTHSLMGGAECSTQSRQVLVSIVRSLVQHRIETGGARPVKLPPRRLPQAQREVEDQLIREMLYAEKDGSPRFCVDYRKLNAMTRVDAQPIPRIGEALAGAKWFSTLDLVSGYWQVEIAERDREKTAFSTSLGLFQFRVMLFGLCNAPTTFQRLMEKALRGLTWNTCLVYLDDIIVFGKTEEEHLERLERVLNNLLGSGVKLQADLLGILIRFRRYRICLQEDIQKMYLQVALPEADRDVCRFLCKESGKDEPLNLTSISYLAIQTIRLNAEKHQADCTGAVSDILPNMYVDDLVVSCNNIPDAKRMAREATRLLGKGGFHLAKWASNSPDVVKEVPSKDQESSDGDNHPAAVVSRDRLRRPAATGSECAGADLEGVEDITRMELHGFVYACGKAYGVVYLRLTHSDGRVECSTITLQIYYNAFDAQASILDHQYGRRCTVKSVTRKREEAAVFVSDLLTVLCDCHWFLCERDLVARFGGGITSREVYRVIRLLEPPTLAEAQKLATRIIQVEDDYQEKQQPRAGIAKPEKTEMAQKIDAMIREMGNLAKKVEQLERTTPRPSRTAPGCFRCGSLDHRRRDCPQLRT